jgi:hypothetical protein
MISYYFSSQKDADTFAAFAACCRRRRRRAPAFQVYRPIRRTITGPLADISAFRQPPASFRQASWRYFHCRHASVIAATGCTDFRRHFASRHYRLCFHFLRQPLSPLARMIFSLPSIRHGQVIAAIIFRFSATLHFDTLHFQSLQPAAIFEAATIAAIFAITAGYAFGQAARADTFELLSRRFQLSTPMLSPFRHRSAFHDISYFELNTRADDFTPGQ